MDGLKVKVKSKLQVACGKKWKSGEIDRQGYKMKMEIEMPHVNATTQNPRNPAVRLP